MSVHWTDEQKQVIDLRNRNILVSAAAGSGKTAVLVERIIQKITDETNPVDVDRLLIVTFTEAAAAEMKERIADAIEKKLEEMPENAFLERQSHLIYHAPITTIHSFCLSVIREYFHVIDLDPGFRIGEEGELKLLKKDVLDELLEECYAQEDERFLEFVEKYGVGRNDIKIEEMILKLFEYSQSYPRPDHWLKKCVEAYEVNPEDSSSINSKEFAEKTKQRIKTRMNSLIQFLNYGMQICDEPDGPYAYAEALESDINVLKEVEECETFTELLEKIPKIKWKRLATLKDATVAATKQERVKSIRETVKKNVKEMTTKYCFSTVQEWAKEMKEAKSSMETLAGLVLRFSQNFCEKKRSMNLIDFNDMEQLALQILTREEEDGLHTTEVAKEYQERFDEVMIDEYQDSNYVQETILKSVSKIPVNGSNMFMVGDVKQSIYSFRLSRPDLFMKKYDTFTYEESESQKIDLHKNFRSRCEVLDSANYLFKQLMNKELGGIEYDDDAALYAGATFPELPEESSEDYKTELLLLEKETVQTEEKCGLEAHLVAKRIKNLIKNGYVTDKATGMLRRVRYRDIVILTRSVKGWSDYFADVFSEEGIPFHVTNQTGYFEAYEVSVLLDYLKILDNYRQDLPLTAVLTSPICGLKADDLAKIRNVFPRVPFYCAVELFAKNDLSEFYDGKTNSEIEQLKERVYHFYLQMQQFRKMVSYLTIRELLLKILDETGYGLYISAMPGGEQRKANVEMLIEKATSFEGTSYKGLFNFVRYIEQLKEYNVEYGEASIVDEQDDIVRMMSIHKSKGLEFPIVFVCGLNKNFNMNDSRAAVVMSAVYGVGLDNINIDDRTKTKTFLKKYIGEEMAFDTRAEEMRILYVAMTRAKEKLIMTAVTPKAYLENVGPSLVEKGNCYLDWIVSAIWDGEEQMQKEYAPFEITLYKEENLKEDLPQVQAEAIALDVLNNWDANRVYDQELGEQLNKQMDYLYPYESMTKMKMKFSVSELKKMSMIEDEEETEESEELVKFQYHTKTIPKFMSEEKNTLSGALRGSAYHKVMELLDFSLDYDEDKLQQTFDDLIAKEKLSDVMVNSIDKKAIIKFLSSNVGKRMGKAAKKNLLYKEQQFVMNVDTDSVYTDVQSEESILVQGIIDVYFEEEDGLVVLDYKTDHVKDAEELVQRYSVQLDYYSEALHKLIGKPVKEKIIYSFELEEEIKI